MKLHDIVRLKRETILHIHSKGTTCFRQRTISINNSVTVHIRNAHECKEFSGKDNFSSLTDIMSL